MTINAHINFVIVFFFGNYWPIDYLSDHTYIHVLAIDILIIRLLTNLNSMYVFYIYVYEPVLLQKSILY